MNKYLKDYTMEELMAERAAMIADPANYNTGRGLCIYTPQAEARLTKIAYAVTALVAEKRAQQVTA